MKSLADARYGKSKNSLKTSKAQLRAS